WTIPPGSHPRFISGRVVRKSGCISLMARRDTKLNQTPWPGSRRNRGSALEATRGVAHARNPARIPQPQRCALPRRASPPHWPFHLGQAYRVRSRLAAGGSRIRTLGPPARVIEIGQDATPREIFAHGKAADRSAAPSAESVSRSRVTRLRLAAPTCAIMPTDQQG